MPLELGIRNRPFVHPRRLTNVGEIVAGYKKKKGKRKAIKRPRPMQQQRSPLTKMAYSLHDARKQEYLRDLNSLGVDDDG